MHSLPVISLLLVVPALTACGGAPTLSNLPPDARAAVCRAFAAEPGTGYGCRAEDVPSVRDTPVYLAEVEFRADGRMKRFTGLRPKVDDITAMQARPPRCVDGEIKLLRTDPPQAIMVPITLRYRASVQAGRASRFEADRCVIDVALVAP